MIEFMRKHFIVLLLISPFVIILAQNAPTTTATTPTPTTTPTAVTKVLPDKIIAQFWRAKNELSIADSNCRIDPNYTAAKAKFDAAVVAIRNFCATDGIYTPEGDPGCPISNPKTAATVPPAQTSSQTSAQTAPPSTPHTAKK